MSSTRPPRSSAIPDVSFHRTKYGPELLVDAAWVTSMPTFFRERAAHRLLFHDILIVTSGRGRLVADGKAITLGPGSVVFSVPGHVRQWLHCPKEGACLFFASEFVEDFFSDPRFLHRLAFFAPGRPSPVSRLRTDELEHLLARFEAMCREIERLQDDTSHLLRAIAYELLIALDRIYRRQWRLDQPSTPHRVADRFLSLVEREYRLHHRLAYYTDQLGVSPGYLRQLCRIHLGCSAGEVIRRRLAIETRRLLRHSDLGFAEIGYRLGFRDPSYFSRFTRRMLGRSPRDYRNERRI